MKNSASNFIVDLEKLCKTTREERKELEEKVEKYFALILGIIRSSINTSDSITIYEHYFPCKEVFAGVMIKVGEYYGDNKDIEICYQKPEDKNPSSPTYGMILYKFVVSNLARIKANKTLTAEHKMAMNSLPKEVKETIVKTVKEKYDKEE